jgi:hypothetical protein
MNAPDAKALDRIRKLIALASSPNENEARNAALLAVTQIRELGVTLSLGTTVAGTGESPNIPVDKPSAIIIPSKFAGRCRACSQPFSVGDSVQWVRGKGAAHEACPWTP